MSECFRTEDRHLLGRMALSMWTASVTTKRHQVDDK